MNKREKEILSKQYISAHDLKILIPYTNLRDCKNFISNVRNEMETKGYYVPSGKTKVALTALVKEKLGVQSES